MKKKSLIVFDIDGTLTDSVSHHQKAFTETLLEIGVSEINADYKTFKHHTDSYIAQFIYQENQNIPFSTEKLQQFERGLSERIDRIQFKEIKGTSALIKKLEQDTNFGVCYATGSLRRPAQHKRKSIGITIEECQLVASDEIYERENIVQQAINNSCDYYNVESFDRIIAVGDGLWDLLTADNLKIEFIGVGEKNKEVLLRNGAKRVLDDLTQFQID